MCKSIDIFNKYEDKIVEEYERGIKVPDLAEEYECSYNTMMIVLGLCGFPSTPYFQKQIDAKVARIEADTQRRTLRDVKR